MVLILQIAVAALHVAMFVCFSQDQSKYWLLKVHAFKDYSKIFENHRIKNPNIHNHYYYEFLEGGCLIQHGTCRIIKGSVMSFLQYYYAALSSHLS